MSHDLLKDFKAFLVTYRESWNSLDASRIMNHASKELKARWAGSEAMVSDSDYEAAEIGWEQAYQSFEGKNPKWTFEDVLVEMNSLQEGVAVFWCRLELEGKVLNDQLLFVETFRKENGEWKKIREYVENGFSNAVAVTGNN